MDTRRMLSSSISPPSNRHRVEITEASIVELAKDIRDRGLINPIAIRKMGETWEVIAGERRYTAMLYLGWPMMEVHDYGEISDAECEAIRLAENVQREQLSPMEEAWQIAALMAKHNGLMYLVARDVHRSEAWCQQRLAIARIPDDLTQDVHNRILSMGSALQIARLPKVEDRNYYRKLAALDGCTIEVLSRWISDHEAQLMRQPDVDPDRPVMPINGGPITVYLACQLCDVPTDTRQRMPRILCQACISVWPEIMAMYREAHQLSEVPA